MAVLFLGGCSIPGVGLFLSSRAAEGDLIPQIQQQLPPGQDYNRGKAPGSPSFLTRRIGLLTLTASSFHSACGAAVRIFGHEEGNLHIRGVQVAMVRTSIIKRPPGFFS